MPAPASPQDTMALKNLGPAPDPWVDIYFTDRRGAVLASAAPAYLVRRR